MALVCQPLALQSAEWVALKSTLLHAHLPPSRRRTVRGTPSLNCRAVWNAGPGMRGTLCQLRLLMLIHS
jgi:hypothetical protein